MTTNTEATPEIKSDRKLAQALQVSTRTIVEWKKLHGSPKKSADGIWNLSEWKKFMQKHGLGNRSKAARDPLFEELKNEKMAAQTRLIVLQTERQELRNAVERGEFIQIDRAREDFSKCYGPMILHLKGTRHRTGQMVVGLASGAAAKVVANDMNESVEKFIVPEPLKKDPFWRMVSESFEGHKKKSGKI